MSIRHAEALSLARTRRMNRKTVRNIFFFFLRAGESSDRK